MSSDVEEVKSRVNIVDVVGDYIRLERAGAGQWKGLCPFHQEKTPSLTVSEERQLWHCFGCARGGDLFSFVMEKEGMDFREALILLAERAGVELTQRQSGGNNAVSVDTKNVLREILALSAQFYTKQLNNGIGKQVALPYLYNRGLSDESIEQFAVGFALDGWRHLTDFLISRKFSVRDIVASGMAIEKSTEGKNGSIGSTSCYDRFRNRIMFPITDPLGRVVGFSGRIMPGGDDKTGKYINSPETAVYHKSAVLYGIAQAKDTIKQIGEVVVVEGQMDVIASHQAGIAQTVAVSGTALTSTHAGIIRRYADTVTLFFDNDTAGRAAGIKSVRTCVAAGLAVKMVVIEGGKDAAEIVVDNPDVLRQAIEQASAALEVLFTNICDQCDVATPAGKRAVVATMAPLIAAHSSTIDREYWTSELATRASISLTAAIEAVVAAQTEQSHYGVPTPDTSSKTTKTASQSSPMPDTITMLVTALLQMVVHSPIALRALATQSFPIKILVQFPVLAFVIEYATEAQYDFAQIIAQCTDVDISTELEQILRTSGDVSLDIQDDKVVQDDVNQLVARLIVAHKHDNRANIIAQITQAELNGDTARATELLTQLK